MQGLLGKQMRFVGKPCWGHQEAELLLPSLPGCLGVLGVGGPARSSSWPDPRLSCTTSRLPPKWATDLGLLFLSAVDGASTSTTEISPLTAMACAPVATVERAPIVTAERAPTAARELPPSPELGQDLAHTNTSPGDSDPGVALPPPPEKGPPSEAGSLGSLPWPEAPEECGPQRPNTLDLFKPLRTLEEVKQAGQRRSSHQAGITENGLEGPPEAPQVSQERQALQSELGRCIQDFRRIRIPDSFPNKKRQWQSELLRKYQL